MLSSVMAMCLVFFYPPNQPASRPASAPASQPASRPSGPAKRVAIKDINHDMVRQRVIVEGEVADIVTKPSRTREKIHIYTVSQDGAKIEAVWWEDLAKKLPADKTPQKGQRVRLTGRVDDYRGKPQLQPNGPRDVEILPDKSKDRK